MFKQVLASPSILLGARLSSLFFRDSVIYSALAIEMKEQSPSEGKRFEGDPVIVKIPNLSTNMFAL